MRELFSMDKKDYDENGRVFSRPSMRAIIEHDGKVLTVYSKKYGYYKLPGGGVEKGESPEETLIREVKEETGYDVIPESIEEYGYVLRRRRDGSDEHAIFEQLNTYYTCQVYEAAGETKLDEYEAEEGYTPIWIEPFSAARCNHYCDSREDRDSIKRDEKVFDMYDLERLKRTRAEHEKSTIASFGDLPFDQMLEFVRDTLEGVESEDIDTKVEINYSRFEHIKHVLGWAKRLYDLSADKDSIRFEDVMIAAIFHDVGRNMADIQHISHAKAGVPITRDYLLTHGFDGERTEYICYLVGAHSDKWLMQNSDVDRGLLLLMEADLLDDMGATGIVMDCMITEARNRKARFTDCLDHITRFTLRQQMDNPMVTPEGRRIWDAKTELTKAFVASLKEDLEL